MIFLSAASAGAAGDVRSTPTMRTALLPEQTELKAPVGVTEQSLPVTQSTLFWNTDELKRSSPVSTVLVVFFCIALGGMPVALIVIPGTAVSAASLLPGVPVTLIRPSGVVVHVPAEHASLNTTHCVVVDDWFTAGLRPNRVGSGPNFVVVRLPPRSAVLSTTHSSAPCGLPAVSKSSHDMVTLSALTAIRGWSKISPATTVGPCRLNTFQLPAAGSAVFVTASFTLEPFGLPWASLLNSTTEP